MAPIHCVQPGLKLNERKCTFALGLMHQSAPLTKFMFGFFFFAFYSFLIIALNQCMITSVQTSYVSRLFNFLLKQTEVMCKHV